MSKMQQQFCNRRSTTCTQNLQQTIKSKKESNVINVTTNFQQKVYHLNKKFATDNKFKTESNVKNVNTNLQQGKFQKTTKFTADVYQTYPSARLVKTNLQQTTTQQHTKFATDPWDRIPENKKKDKNTETHVIPVTKC